MDTSSQQSEQTSRGRRSADTTPHHPHPTPQTRPNGKYPSQTDTALASVPAPLGSVPLLERPLAKVVGTRTAEHLARQGARTAGDLLRLLPRRYDTWGDLTNLRSLVDGEHATVQVQIVHATSRRTRSGRPPALMEAVVTDGATTMDVVLFGAAGLMNRYAQQLHDGSTAVMSGKVSSRRGRRQLTNPRFHILDDLDDAERRDLLARPMPIYPASDALPSWRVRRAVTTVLDQLTPADILEPLPDHIRQQHGFIDAFTAWQWIHRPNDANQWRCARERLRYEEAFVLQSALAHQRLAHATSHTAVAWPEPGEDSLSARLDASLPFPLTSAQQRVGRQLAEALESATPMQVLVQGDVGSGKTLVALRAMLRVVDGGGQAALLAPTEILAAQHHASLEELLGSAATVGMLGAPARATRIYLLTGSTPSGRRRDILAALAGGEPAIVVGTHALLSASVHIPFLGLVVVDEQHRFGVEQRDALRERGDVTDPDTGEARTPHLLVMTATPIPRTIAMTIFGDLDTAVLDELPPGRQPVATHLVPWEREQWVAGIWRRAAQEIAAGGRVYVVCPRIDPGDTGDPAEADSLITPTMGTPVQDNDEPSRSLACVNQWVDNLRDEPALAGIGIGTLTGRMSQAEKDAAMADFASGRTPVLVATTVVEVGVNVPEATMMVILDADRFGISQLHQLRGRVGRSSAPALCVAVTGVDVGSLAYHRLHAFARTTDGFELAEADLELRSEGNVLGAAQSGRRSDLDLLTVSRDGDIIAQARADAAVVLGEDPTLLRHRDLAKAIAQRLDEQARTFLERAS